MRRVTSQTVIAFTDYMLKIHKGRLINKESAWEMWVIGRCLSLAKVMDAEKFMENYAITLGRRIYTPFEPGDDKNFSLWSQIETITHECQHIRQFGEHPVKFPFGYLTSSSKRAHYEAIAYRTNLEMRFWRTGKILDPYRLSSGLYDYGCTRNDVRMVASMLEAAGDLITIGNIVTPATVNALNWIRPHLL